MPRDALRDLLDRFADGDPVEWTRITGADPPLLDALHTLEAVRSAYRRIGSTDGPPERCLFEWGALRVLEKIGSGASAEVYRAWDAGLATVVALKLLRPEAAAAGLRNEEFLREGRLLAKISQRNVLRVYGAAVHCGRPGLWSEWIEGRTLASIVESDGPMAEAEAVHVGVELCAGLAAIHALGLLHGDVKASNAMRARGGRIVLTDLGASGRADALNASLRTQATPAYLSPQARDGAPRTKADDLYALGVLLHFLLTGAYPENGASRILALRPDIDRRLADVVERALDADVSRRFTDAHAFADALRASMAAAAPARPARSRRLALAAVAICLAAAAAAVAFGTRHPGVRAWRSELALMRHTDTGSEALADGARLRIGDRVHLAVSTSVPAWVYVLNEDAGGDFHVLFPVPGLDLSNPVSGDVTLPGRQGARTLSWEVSGTGGREEFLVLLSRVPLARLDRQLAALPVAAVERGVARARPDPPGDLRLSGEHLNTLLADLREEIADASRVRMRAWHFNDNDDPVE
jgi:tRNA A-37 threonylcarbamoyl transferase component Bud32